jgi:hypothetical protein
MIPLSDRVPGRASGPSRPRDDDGGLQYIFWKSVCPLRVFPLKGIYRLHHGAAAPWSVSVSPLDSVFMSGK